MNTVNEKEQKSVVNEEKTGLFVRQPLPALGKVAFWASVVVAIGGIGGAIALTILTGSLNWDSTILAVTGLATVVILATRFRWASLVSTVLGGSIIYQLYTQPYVFESLSHPKGSNGGFGKFVGEVVLMALAFLVFGGSIGAALQNYWERIRRDQRWLTAVLSLATGILIGALFIGAISQAPSDTGTAYTNGVPTVHMSAGSFDQASVTIAKGSKLLLVDDVSSVHILENGSWQNNVPKTERKAGAPPLNNVQLNGNSVEIGPFPLAGTYHIYCVVHQGMNLTIIVQ
jgi:plastocyanin